MLEAWPCSLASDPEFWWSPFSTATPGMKQINNSIDPRSQMGACPRGSIWDKKIPKVSQKMTKFTERGVRQSVTLIFPFFLDDLDAWRGNPSSSCSPATERDGHRTRLFYTFSISSLNQSWALNLTERNANQQKVSSYSVTVLVSNVWHASTFTVTLSEWRIK